MLSATGMGLMALNRDGMVVMITRSAAAIMGEGGDKPLPAALLEFISSGETDSFSARVDFLNLQPPAERDRDLRILEAIDHPILNEEGELLGLILKGT